MSSALCLSFVIALAFSLAQAKETNSCQGKHSLWDKWYDGCNWCVCMENGPVCTNKSCSRIFVDRCDPVGEKWRDGCYRCHCSTLAIMCYADHKCVHAMKYTPVLCNYNPGCVCGIDGVPSCLPEIDRVGNVFPGLKKRPGRKYIANDPHASKYRHEVFVGDMSCTKAKRWYAGSQRCFCEDGAQKPQCDNPRHIAHRIDGYRSKVTQCYSNQKWNYNCKKCKCHMYGFGFCVRIPNCKRNGLSHIDRKLPHRLECQPLSRWREGCMDCSCTADSRRICVNSDCNASGNIAEAKVTVNMPKISLGEGEIILTEGGILRERVESPPRPVHETKLPDKIRSRFQIPPASLFHLVRRFRPRVNTSGLQELRCEGKYRLRERYYIKCNYCRCTRTGDSICTGILCV